MQFQLFILCTVLMNVGCGVWVNEDVKDEESRLGKRSPSNDNELYVQISNGFLMGWDTGDYYSYESIPYAEAPIGKLRFEAPLPYRKKWKTVFNASVRSQPCLQWHQFEGGDDLLTGIEDCLTLNVHKPKRTKPKGGKYPVMVFLHGGCFMFGDVKPYDPIYLMNSGKIIVVQITYRLGPLGFLSTEDKAITGNFGLKDQQMALKWIQENIAAFEGNPKEVMLTGFSAGGASTHLQLLHPQGKDLMKTAVSFSGVALNPWVIQRNAREDAFKMASILKCPVTKDSYEIKRCLQSKPPEDIVRAVKHFLNYGYNPFTTFGPVVEYKYAPNAFMTRHPRDIIKSGTFSHIPWLATYTAQDGAYNAAELLQIDPNTGREFIYTLNDNWKEFGPKNLFLDNIKDNPLEYAMQLKDQFLGSEDLSVDNYLKVQDMYTFVDFAAGVQESMKLHSVFSKDHLYGYIYDNPPDWSMGNYVSRRADIKFGSSHFDDVSLILKYPVRISVREDEEEISKNFVNMLISFVKTAKPIFGKCEFQNNAGKQQMQFMHITNDSCKSITPLPA